jgi:flagellar biosynthesis component FlhA
MDLAQTDALSGRFSFVSKNTDLVLGIATISILLIMIIPIPTIGIIITIVNLLAGFAIGVFQKGLSFSEAAQTYTLLTAGDGLVSQIPALIISTAGGIVVSRAGAESNLGLEIGSQLMAWPRARAVASAMRSIRDLWLADCVAWRIWSPNP